MYIFIGIYFSYQNSTSIAYVPASELWYCGLYTCIYMYYIMVGYCIVSYKNRNLTTTTYIENNSYRKQCKQLFCTKDNEVA